MLPCSKYVIDSDSDNLEFFVQSAPGVGTGTAYTRELAIALSGSGASSYSEVSTDAGCRVEIARFELNSIPSGVTVTTSASDLTTDATGTQATCFFNQRYQVAWESFRDASTLANCGFAVSENASALSNGVYRTYKGRIHVLWEDFETVAASTPIRPNMTTWYDVTIQIQSEANRTTAATNNTETPYNADFKVSEFTYSKSTSGVVTANIAYQLSTAFPYYVGMPSTDAFDFLIHTGSGATASYSGLVLGQIGSTSYPGGTWSNVFTRAGKVVADDSPCDAPGETCQMTGILTYTWTPTPSIVASCSLSASSPYQFDFVLECDSAYNGTLGSVCGVRMREALDLSVFGSFRLQGNIDFCQSAATDFPITWGPVFDVASTSRSIGQTIEASGAFTTSKQLSAVAIKEYRVARSDLTGFWSLWTAADNTAVSAASAGAITSVGTNTNFLRGITLTNGGKTVAISTSFTPNIRMLNSLTTLDTVTSRGDYLITLPNDKGVTLSFTITLIIRMYSDTTQNFDGARRRLVYRDVVQTIPSSGSVKESVIETLPIGVKVPENIQISQDGTVTVVSVQSGVSTGAIAGIAAIGAAVGIAAVGLTIFIVRRKKNAVAAPSAVPEYFDYASKAAIMSKTPSSKYVVA